MTRYAFEHIKLKKLEIRVATVNPASALIPQKLNFELNGLLPKEEASHKGELWDLEIYSILDPAQLPKLRNPAD